MPEELGHGLVVTDVGTPASAGLPAIRPRILTATGLIVTFRKINATNLAGRHAAGTKSAPSMSAKAVPADASGPM